MTNKRRKSVPKEGGKAAKESRKQPGFSRHTTTINSFKYRLENTYQELALDMGIDMLITTRNTLPHCRIYYGLEDG